MNQVLAATAIYLFLIVVFRIAGKRSLRDLTVFDLVLLLVLSEATQQALIGEDSSLSGAFIVIATLIALEILLAFLKHRFKGLDKLLDGVPVVLVEHGKPIEHRLDRERIDAGDILEAARSLRGLERMEEIKYALLERDGSITIVPQR